MIGLGSHWDYLPHGWDLQFEKFEDYIIYYNAACLQEQEPMEGPMGTMELKGTHEAQ